MPGWPPGPPASQQAACTTRPVRHVLHPLAIPQPQRTRIPCQRHRSGTPASRCRGPQAVARRAASPPGSWHSARRSSRRQTSWPRTRTPRRSCSCRVGPARRGQGAMRSGTSLDLSACSSGPTRHVSSAPHLPALSGGGPPSLRPSANTTDGCATCTPWVCRTAYLPCLLQLCRQRPILCTAREKPSGVVGSGLYTASSHSPLRTAAGAAGEDAAERGAEERPSRQGMPCHSSCGQAEGPAGRHVVSAGPGVWPQAGCDRCSRGAAARGAVQPGGFRTLAGAEAQVVVLVRGVQGKLVSKGGGGGVGCAVGL